MTGSAGSLEPAPQFVLSDSPDPREVQLLESRLDEFNLSHTGIRDVRYLSIIVRNRDAAVGGLYGWTWGGCLEVKTVWVDEAWRGRGVGTRLLTMAETEARARGARQIILSTHSFQAPDFYSRFGFEVAGYIDDYPIGHRSIYLRKGLR